MKRTLLMDFSVDKENMQINIKKEFATPLSKVWTAWTEPRYLDQWWSPSPWKTQTQSMDFREGGHWHYLMTDGDGKNWCRMDYQKISIESGYKALDAFSDQDGKINDEFPRTLWDVVFLEGSDVTLVSVQLSYKSLADLETIVELGFKEGITAAIYQLENLLNDKTI